MDNHVHKDIVKDSQKVLFFNTGNPHELEYHSIHFGGL